MVDVPPDTRPDLPDPDRPDQSLLVPARRDDALRVVVLAGGDRLPPALDSDIADAIDRAAFSVAADGGIRHAHRAGRDVDVLVGDLDSISSDDLARAEAGAIELLRHPVDKDATDLELALDLVLDRTAAQLRPVEVLVVGGHGGRTDHLLANLLLLSAERYARLRLSAWWGADVVHVVRSTAVLAGRIGSTVSLSAMHGPARGVTTVGLHFALTDAELIPGSTLGVSNRLSSSPAVVSVREGVVVVLHGPPSEPS